LICLGLVVSTLLAFGQVKDFEFINYDDNHYVSENRRVQAGLSLDNFKWAFSTMDVANWQPLTWLSYMFDCYIFGPDPGRLHLINLLFHLLNTLLLFSFLKSTTGHIWRSCCVAALFALHPLHVESVAWISERKDVLSTLFGLLALISYSGYSRRQELRLYLSTVFFFALSLMAKPMLVTLPFVLLLLDYWPLGRLASPESERTFYGLHPPAIHRVVLEKIPLFALTALSCLITLQAQQHSGAIQSLVTVSFLDRLGNALLAYNAYIFKMFWPSGLAVFYPWPENILVISVVLSTAFLLIITFTAIKYIESKPYLVVGWLWYLGTLVPVIGLVQVGFQAMADRYTYIPLIGLFIIVIWGAADLSRRFEAPGFLLPLLAVLAGSVLLMATHRQTGHWQNSITVFRHARQVTERNFIANNNLGVALHQLGDIDGAIARYLEALQFKPDYAEAHSNLGVVLQKKGRVAEAISHYREAIRITPSYSMALNNWGTALESQGRHDEAIAKFRQALVYQPTNVSACYNMGKVLQHIGQTDLAISYFSKALSIDPDRIEALDGMGRVLIAQGRPAEAIDYYSKTLRLRPDSAEAHNNMGVAFKSRGDLDQAMEHYAKAIQIDPGYVEAHNNLGAAYLEQEDLEKALASFRTAVRVRSDHAKIRNNLGIVLRDMGRNVEARKHFWRAVQIEPDFINARYNLAGVLIATGEPAAAIEQYRHTLRLKPDYADAHYKLGLVLLAQRQPAEAAGHLQKTVALLPHFEKAHNSLGVALGMDGQLDAAIAHFTQALEIMPEYAEAHFNLGLVLFRKGMLVEAERHFKAALRIKPGYGKARANLEKIQLQMQK